MTNEINCAMTIVQKNFDSVGRMKILHSRIKLKTPTYIMVSSWDCLNVCQYNWYNAFEWKRSNHIHIFQKIVLEEWDEAVEHSHANIFFLSDYADAGCRGKTYNVCFRIYLIGRKDNTEIPRCCILIGRSDTISHRTFCMVSKSSEILWLIENGHNIAANYFVAILCTLNCLDKQKPSLCSFGSQPTPLSCPRLPILFVEIFELGCLLHFGKKFGQNPNLSNKSARRNYVQIISNIVYYDVVASSPYLLTGYWAPR